MSEQLPKPAAAIRSTLLEDDADLRDIVVEFVDGLDARISELRSAYERLDWETLRVLAHRLKGAGGSYGYPQLSDLARKMEDDFRNHCAESFSVALRQLAALTQAAQMGLAD